MNNCFRGALWAAVMTIATGCGEKSKKSDHDASDSASSAKAAASDLPISEEGGCKGAPCRFQYNAIKDEISGWDLKQAKARLGAQKLAPKEDGTVEAKVDWAAAIVGSPLALWTTPTAGKPGPTKLEVAAELPDGRHFRGGMSVSKEAFVIKSIETFAKLKTGPMPAEPEGKGKALLWIPSRDMRQSNTPVLIGEAKTLGDVELVAITEDLEPIKKSCGLYRNTSTGETGQIGTKTYEVDVTTYERRTGKVRDKKRFTPKAQECPQSMAGGGFPDLGSTMNGIDVVDYVKTLAGK